MLKKRLMAICTAAIILLSTITASAKPLGLYLQSKTNPSEYIYISYSDYTKAYASKNEAFRKILQSYEVKGISVNSDQNKKVIDYSEYIKEYQKGNVENLDEYVDSQEVIVYQNPEKVKELNIDGSIGEEINAPDKPDNNPKDYLDIVLARVKAKGEEVTIKGIVTGNLGNNAFVQDATGGIYVFLENTPKGDLTLGNVVKVTGKLDEYQNLKQINYKLQPIKVEKLGVAQLPEPKLVTASEIGEVVEGQLVTIKDLTITSISANASSGYDINAKDKDNKDVYVRVDKNVNIPSSNFKVNYTIDVTAPVGQFGLKYQLMLRNVEDVKVVKDDQGQTPQEATINNFMRCSILKGIPLPAELRANMSDGSTKTFKVQWPIGIDMNELGLRTVNITVDGKQYPVELEIKEPSNPGDINLPEELKLYYNDAFGKTGNDLRQALHDIIDDHKKLDYGTVWDAIKETDEDPNNKNNVILLYKGTSTPKSNNGGLADQWNREHVWAKSRGDFGTSKGPGTDVHHLRAEDVSVNGARGHLDFDNGGTPNSEAPQNKADSDSWEPRDAVKGDVARMLFYMAIRYEGDASGEPDLEIIDRVVKDSKNPQIGKLSTLLQWHKQDPVDDGERRRNDIIYKNWQGNRNPFIDNPEWVDSINWVKTPKVNADTKFLPMAS